MVPNFIYEDKSNEALEEDDHAEVTYKQWIYTYIDISIFMDKQSFSRIPLLFPYPSSSCSKTQKHVLSKGKR